MLAVNIINHINKEKQTELKWSRLNNGPLLLFIPFGLICFLHLYLSRGNALGRKAAVIFWELV